MSSLACELESCRSALCDACAISSADVCRILFRHDRITVSVSVHRKAARRNLRRIFHSASTLLGSKYGSQSERKRKETLLSKSSTCFAEGAGAPLDCPKSTPKHPHFWFDFIATNSSFSIPVAFCIIVGYVEDVTSFYMKLFRIVR